MEYYNILQIEPGATNEEIKSAFRKLSFNYYDKTASSMDKYNKIIEAYKYLSSNNLVVPYIETNQINKINDIYTTVTIKLTDIYNDTSIPIQITRTITKQTHTIEETETLYIHICSGIDTNEIIIINNKGNIIENTQGDIKVKIIVYNNSIFKREGLNLILNKEITLKESLCGFEFNFTHINNEIYYIKNNNNIIYPFYQKILPQLGLKRNTIYGQLIIKFTIIFPTQLSEKHKHILSTIL